MKRKTRRKDRQDAAGPVMPHGIHRGKPIVKLPVEYIRWCLEGQIDDDVREMLTDELIRRNTGG